MSKRKKLEFKTKRHEEKAKSKRFFLIFSIVLLLFGTVSALVFLKSVDFDLSNLFDEREKQTVTEETTIKTEPVASGSANFLAMCVSNDSLSVRFIAVINANLDGEKKQIRVACLSPKDSVQLEGKYLTLEEHFRQGGAAQTAKAIESSNKISIERYVCSNDTGFMDALKIIDKKGTLPLHIKQQIEYKEEFNLFLSAGDQTVRGETLLNYFRYLCIKGTDDDWLLQAQTVSDMLRFFITKTNFEKGEELFSPLINCMQRTNTNITGFDFNNSKTLIAGLITLDTALEFGVEKDLAPFVKNAVTATGEDIVS